MRVRFPLPTQEVLCQGDNKIVLTANLPILRISNIYGRF